MKKTTIFAFMLIIVLGCLSFSFDSKPIVVDDDVGTELTINNDFDANVPVDFTITIYAGDREGTELIWPVEYYSNEESTSKELLKESSIIYNNNDESRLLSNNTDILLSQKKKSNVIMYNTLTEGRFLLTKYLYSPHLWRT